MARTLGFFALVFVLLGLLRFLPGVGHYFGGFFSFWLVAIGLSLALARGGALLTSRRHLASQMRALVDVETAHNQGKLGCLLLAHGRPARALPHLERAVAGEPEVAEWSYRRGLALLRLRRFDQGAQELERAAALDPEHAYGGVQLALSEARLRHGDGEGALAAVENFERNHGPSPESAYRRGRALRSLSRGEEARAALVEACELGGRAARFQRARNRPWVLRAWLARWI